MLSNYNKTADDRTTLIELDQSLMKWQEEICFDYFEVSQARNEMRRSIIDFCHNGQSGTLQFSHELLDELPRELLKLPKLQHLDLRGCNKLADISALHYYNPNQLQSVIFSPDTKLELNPHFTDKLSKIIKFVDNNGKELKDEEVQQQINQGVRNRRLRINTDEITPGNSPRNAKTEEEEKTYQK